MQDVAMLKVRLSIPTKLFSHERIFSFQLQHDATTGLYSVVAAGERSSTEERQPKFDRTRRSFEHDTRS